MKSAMLLILEDEGHVIVTAAAAIASSFLHPAIIVNPCLQNQRTWSFDSASAALEEIHAECAKEAFRHKLDAVFDKPGLTEKEKETQCSQLLLEVRRPVFEKFDQRAPAVASTDDDGDDHRVVELMSRRLAAFEMKAISDRKKAHEKRLSEVHAKARSKMYVQQNDQVELDPEDYLRRSLLMHAPSDQIKKQRPAPDIADSGGYDAEDYVRRMLQMQSQQQQQQKASSSWWIFGSGNEAVDSEDYVRRSLQMQADEAEDKEDYIRRSLQMSTQLSGH